MILKVKGRVIIIVGQKCTGKTSLAKQLLKKNPFGEGVIIPYNGDDSYSKYKQDKLQIIIDAVKNKLFTVIVCEDISVKEIKEIIWTCLFKGGFCEIQVLKLAISDQLHEEYLIKGNKHYTKETMAEDKEKYQPILNEDFTELFVTQKTLHSPRIRKFEF